jgi:alpha-L-rhamnosidase
MSPLPGWQKGDPEHTNTLFFYYNLLLAAKMAGVLGRGDEKERHETAAAEMRQAILARYYDRERKVFADGSQFSLAFALKLDLIPPEDTDAVMAHLIDDIERVHKGHLTTGIFGTKYLLEELARRGRPDTAYKLLMAEGFPGWKYMLAEGATTLYETWDRQGSGNHGMFGSVDAWLYRFLAGISPDEEEPGFQRAIIKPYAPPGLSRVRASLRTVRGVITSGWERRDGKLVFDVTLPPGVTGEFYAPGSPAGECRLFTGSLHTVD